MDVAWELEVLDVSLTCPVLMPPTAVSPTPILGLDSRECDGDMWSPKPGKDEGECRLQDDGVTSQCDDTSLVMRLDPCDSTSYGLSNVEVSV